MTQQFTQEDLEAFSAYEAVRLSGEYNMFFPQAMHATRLTRDTYVFVMNNYASLKEAFFKPH